MFILLTIACIDSISYTIINNIKIPDLDIEHIRPGGFLDQRENGNYKDSVGSSEETSPPTWRCKLQFGPPSISGDI